MEGKLKGFPDGFKACPLLAHLPGVAPGGGDRPLPTEENSTKG